MVDLGLRQTQESLSVSLILPRQLGFFTQFDPTLAANFPYLIFFPLLELRNHPILVIFRIHFLAMQATL